MATPRRKRYALPDGFYSTGEFFSGDPKFRELAGMIGWRHRHTYSGFRMVDNVPTLVLCGDEPKPEPVAIAAPAPVEVAKPKTRKKPAKKPGAGLWSLGSAELREVAAKYDVEWPKGAKKQDMVKPIKEAIAAVEA